LNSFVFSDFFFFFVLYQSFFFSQNLHA